MSRKPVAAVLLADEQRTFLLAKLLEQEQFQPLVLSSTDDFYEVINRDCVDLAIIDNRIRGFLSGIEVLERMYRDLVKPVTILLASPSVEVERRARKLGVDRLLPANTRLEEVVASAGPLVNAYLHDRVLIPQPARTLVQQGGFISPLPQVLVRMSAYLGSEDEHAEEKLARDISVDARLTAELLKLTNSSAMGRPFKTTNVFEAVRYLGVRRTVSMVLSAGICRAQSPMLQGLSPQLRNWYQYRSVLIGSAASAFATELEDVAPPTAYLLGLLQDIGSLVLGHAYGSRYDQLLERVQQISHLRREQLELQDFGTDHAQVSAALLQKWELPPTLVSLVLRHHEPETADELPTVEQAFLRVMRIGERVADVADVRSARRFLDLNDTLSAYGKSKSNECKRALRSAIDQATASSQVFRIPIPDQIRVDVLAEELASRCVIGDRSVATLPASVETTAGGESQTPPAMGGEEDCEPTHVDKSCHFKLLVIEDEPVMTKLIRRFVDGMPIDVHECMDLQGAIQGMANVELILCDVHLSPIEGPEIIRELRTRGYQGRVVIMSGDNSRDNVMSCIDLGIDNFLIKPFSGKHFLHTIGQLLPMAANATPTAEKVFG